MSFWLCTLFKMVDIFAFPGLPGGCEVEDQETGKLCIAEILQNRNVG